MTIVNFDVLFEEAFEDMSVVEIEAAFDGIMKIGMRVKHKMQVKAAVPTLSAEIGAQVYDMTIHAMQGDGCGPTIMYYDEAPAVMGIEDVRIVREGMQHPGKTKKKTGFVGANNSHQNILNKQRRKKR